MTNGTPYGLLDFTDMLMWRPLEVQKISIWDKVHLTMHFMKNKFITVKDGSFKDSEILDSSDWLTFWVVM